MQIKGIPFKFDPVKTIMAVVIIVLLIVSVFFFIQTNNSKQTKGTELEKLMTKLSKVIELPQETPTYATVTDKTKLPNEPFYKNAENGDKVLIFNTAKKAILYRPSTGKIIEFVTVSIAEKKPQGLEQKLITPTSVSNMPSITAPVSSGALLSPVTFNVALFNATNIPNLTRDAEKTIKEKTGLQFTVTKRGDAKGDYTRSLVVDQTGKYGDLASKIAGALNGEVGVFPEDEASISADIVVFVVR